MKFIATFALLMTASSAVRIQNTNEVPAEPEQLIQTKSQEQVNAEALATLENRVDNMEEEMWNLWKKANNFVHHNAKA